MALQPTRDLSWPLTDLSNLLPEMQLPGTIGKPVSAPKGVRFDAPAGPARLCSSPTDQQPDQHPHSERSCRRCPWTIVHVLVRDTSGLLPLLDDNHLRFRRSLLDLLESIAKRLAHVLVIESVNAVITRILRCSFHCTLHICRRRHHDLHLMNCILISFRAHIPALSARSPLSPTHSDWKSDMNNVPNRIFLGKSYAHFD